jgi:hypothetical protein
MTWFTPTLLFLVAWLAVFTESQLAPLRALLGVPVSVLPALIVYVAFSHGLILVTALAVMVGLWTDSLSGSRLGSAVAPHFVVAFLLNTRRHLLLRDQRYAQSWLGFAAGIVIPLGHAAILHFGPVEPLFGWRSLPQLIVLGLLNGAACPAFFILFDHLRNTFEYPAIPGVSAHGIREMKRGRT